MLLATRTHDMVATWSKNPRLSATYSLTMGYAIRCSILALIIAWLVIDRLHAVFYTRARRHRDQLDAG